MNFRIRDLLTVMMVAVLCCSTSFAMSMLNRVPAVTGAVIDQDGAAIEGVNVTVKFFGTNDSLLNDEKEAYVIKEFAAVTDGDGLYHFDGCMINLPNPKAKFLEAEIIFSKEGYKARKLQAVNMRVMGGAIGVFLIGLIDAQGEFDGDGPGVFPTVAHAYKAMKDSKFGRIYKKLVEDEPMRLERLDGQSVKTSQFDKLYKD